MQSYFKFDKQYIDSIVVILEINMQFKGNVHRIIYFSITCNKFVLPLVYHRVTGDPQLFIKYLLNLVFIPSSTLR